MTSTVLCTSIMIALFNFTAGQDFVAWATALGFSPGENIIFLSIFTSTDSLNEGDEVFGCAHAGSWYREDQLEIRCGYSCNKE